MSELNNNCEDLPYRIETLKDVGRCVIASRNLDPLETILVDKAIAIGPRENADDSVPCIACLTPLTELSFCPQCKLPLCQQSTCQTQESLHSSLECKLLSDTAYEFRSSAEVSKFIKCLLVVRLILRESRDIGFKEELAKLMDHNEVRRKDDPEEWEKIQEEKVDFLNEAFAVRAKKFGDFSKPNINRIIGVIRTNSIQLKILNTQTGEMNLHARGLLPKFSLLSHNCVSNARCVQLKNGTVQVLAQRKIQEGEEITISYTSLLLSTLRRRKLLRKNWCFDCNCQRCSDPTEFESNLGAMKCPNEDCQGILHPYFEEDQNIEEYYCVVNKKDHKISSKSILKLEAEIERKLEESCAQMKGEKLLQFLEELNQNTKALGPTHYLKMRIYSELISLLGNIPGYFYFQLPTQQLEQKIGLCRDFMQVFDKIDPGSTDWRAMTLYELALTSTTLAQRKLDKQSYGKDDFRKELQVILNQLKEVAKLMQVEEDNTYGFEISLRARKSAIDIKDLIHFSEFL